MKFYLLFVLLPMIIISIVRGAGRRKRAAQHTEAPFSATMPEPVLRKESGPAAKIHLQPDQAISIHAEGKHPLEIELQREKIQAAEQKNAWQEETRREIKEMDLRHLRTAVIMSEILDRPVSLRRKG